MEISVIKNESQYREYLEAISGLVTMDPDPATQEGKRLELLSVLVEDYEKSRFRFSDISPIDAILFRMEESGLRQKDLVPYIGSKSKVSEVIAGKRSLSLSMIRNLSSGLGIPLDALVADPKKPDVDADDSRTHLLRHPWKEMAKRGWIAITQDAETDDVLSKVHNFFAEVGGTTASPAYFRRTVHFGGTVTADHYAINAWIARVLLKAREFAVDRAEFENIGRDSDFLSRLAKLSWSEQGPILAREFLARNGIALVIEPHLPRTKLDGAATLDTDGTPVIGLTLRFDRIDNFWFTLLHEVVHVLKHLKSTGEAYVDNTSSDPDGEKRESEANREAQDALIPRHIWRRSDAYRLQTTEAVISLARELEIHPAIVAGRIRKETHNYKKFSKLVGQGQISKVFAESGEVT